jgi:hypothetical protein
MEVGARAERQEADREGPPGRVGKHRARAAAAPRPRAGRPRAADSTTAIPGDGNTATAKVPTFGLSAVFTQKGTEVTVVVTATKCPAGAHTIHIHEGFACDDPTNKPIWGGKRGDGFGTLTCTADQKGTLTHTRSGADPATKWTLGDQNLMTDVTLHPIFIDGQSCGTFF